MNSTNMLTEFKLALHLFLYLLDDRDVSIAISVITVHGCPSCYSTRVRPGYCAVYSLLPLSRQECNGRLLASSFSVSFFITADPTPTATEALDERSLSIRYAVRAASCIQLIHNHMLYLLLNSCFYQNWDGMSSDSEMLAVSFENFSPWFRHGRPQPHSRTHRGSIISYNLLQHFLLQALGPKSAVNTRTEPCSPALRQGSYTD